MSTFVASASRVQSYGIKIWSFPSVVTILNVFLGNYFVKTKDGKQYLIETKEDFSGGEVTGGHGYEGKVC